MLSSLCCRCGHAFTVYKSMDSRPRCQSVVNMEEASENAPRDIQGGCRKRADFKGYGRMDAAIGEIERGMSSRAVPFKIHPFSGGRRPTDPSRGAFSLASNRRQIIGICDCSYLRAKWPIRRTAAREFPAARPSKPIQTTLCLGGFLPVTNRDIGKLPGAVFGNISHCLGVVGR